MTYDDVEVWIPRTPLAKARPRFRVFKGRVITYTPKETADYEQFVAEQIRAHYADYRAYAGKVTLDMTFYMPIPKSLESKFRYHTKDCSSVASFDAVVMPEAAMYGTLYTPCRRCKPKTVVWYVPLYPLGKPDIDNLEKAIMDGLQKSEVIKDDKQVIEKHSKKEYSTLPGTLIRIRLDK